MKRLFTDGQEREIVRRYLAGESSDELAKAYNTNGRSILNVLVRNGVDRRPAAHKRNPIVTDDQKRKAVELCQSGITLEEAADRCGIHRNTVWKSTQKAGVSLYVGRRRTCEINDAAFDVLTPTSLYWQGFLFADGCISDKDQGSPRLAIGLSAVDREHLVKLRTFLGSTHAITDHPPRDSKPTFKGGPVVKTGPTAYFSVRSKDIFAVLRSRGIVAKGLRIPPSELATSRDFWRGAIDGDGSLGIGRHRYKRRGAEYDYPFVKLAGQYLFVKKFGDFLRRERLAPLNPHEGDKVWLIGTCGTTAVEIIRRLYQNADCFLDRKMERATEILRGVATYLGDEGGDEESEE